MGARTRRVRNQEQMLYATSRRRGGRAGHSCEMTSRHSHTPTQECWENKRKGREEGPGDRRHGMKKDCHFIRPVVMGFQKDADELLWLVFTEKCCGEESKARNTHTHTHTPERERGKWGRHDWFCWLKMLLMEVRDGPQQQHQAP